MNFPLLILLAMRNGHIQAAAAVQAGAIAQDHGFRVRVLAAAAYRPEHLELEERVLFIAGGFPEEDRFWQQVVLRPQFDLQSLRFSVLTLGDMPPGQKGQSGAQLEAALAIQRAIRAYPRMDCEPDDEMSLRVWLCGALAALKLSSPANP